MGLKLHALLHEKLTPETHVTVREGTRSLCWEEGMFRKIACCKLELSSREASFNCWCDQGQTRNEQTQIAETKAHEMQILLATRRETQIAETTAHDMQILHATRRETSWSGLVRHYRRVSFYRGLHANYILQLQGLILKGFVRNLCAQTPIK